MTESGVLNRIGTRAWQGWIRAGSPLGDSQQDGPPRRVEVGAAVFSLPEPAEATTTSWTRQGGLFAVFTGYLYNRLDLAARLGCDPVSASQAEILLAAYRRWQDGLLQELEGAYTLAVWDQTSETLLCARDTVGLHPLFFSETADGLVFSWDLHTVRRHPLVPRELDPVVLAEHLTHHLVDPADTFFRGIRRVPGGHALTMARGRHRVFRYWNPLPERETDWVAPEQVGQFHGLFRRSVEGIMRCGNGRAGIYLSGGIDSVSVASYAADVAREHGWAAPRAYSVDFPAHGSEAPVQSAVAQALRFPQTFLSITKCCEGTGLLRRVLDLGEHYPSPPNFIYAPAYLELLHKAKEDGCGVILTGDGGDETLTVTPAYCADLIWRGRWREIWRELRTLARGWEAPAWADFRTALWTWGVRALARDWIWRRAPGLAMRRRRQLIPTAFPPWIAPDPSLRRQLIARFEEKWDRVSIRDGAYLARINESLVNPGMHIVFEEQFYRHSMVGVPTLHPYWNRPVTDFLFRTPPHILNQGARSKSLVRKTLAEQFPQLGFLGQKKPTIQDFSRQLFRRELGPLWQELGRPLLMAELGLVDADRYQATLSSHLTSGETRRLYEMWHGAALEQWLRYHF